MQKYTVYLDTNVQSTKMAEFDTLEQAKAYCDSETKGHDEVADTDNAYEGRGNNFAYEVYHGEPVEVIDGEPSPKPSVYRTRQYYFD